MNRILIVDDKPDNLYLLRALLQGNGHIVEEAHHGAEALLKARQNPPDLIISDLLMPVMDGYTLLRQWKSDDQLRTIPFVIHTATYTDSKDKRLGMELGASDFILKPAEPEPFMERIRQVLAKGQEEPLRANRGPEADPTGLYREYSEVLIRKLEEKCQQLENSNLALHADIAERKRVEASLRLLHRAIESVYQGIVITDARLPDNPIIYVSPGFERITGYGAEEVLGKNCRFLQGKDTNPAALAQLRKSVQLGQSCTVELLNYRKDGVPFWNNLMVSPVRDPSGKLTHFVALQTDMTERRQLEEQFRQSQKMEAVGQLAGGVAHDFNNLLTVINGYCDILLDELRTEDPMRELVAEIHKAGQRAETLTRQLLAFSRRQVLEPKALDLNTVLLDVEKLLRRLTGNDIKFVTSLAPDLGRIKSDPGQIEQLVMNLVVNARDAMPAGGKLTIETRSVTLDPAAGQVMPDLVPGRYIELSVSDTGCGMDESVQARIFEPFFTTKKIGKGTGLGLATVHGIVKLSRGYITVTSQLGRGTTFKVYFPETPEAILPDAPIPR